MRGRNSGHASHDLVIKEAIAMSPVSGKADNLIFVDPSPVARRLLWHLFSIGVRRVEQTDRHERFEKPGAHLFWVQSGEGELEYRSRRFRLRRGGEVQQACTIIQGAAHEDA